MSTILASRSDWGDYISAEDQNFRKNLLRLHDVPNLIDQLSEIWLRPTGRLNISALDADGVAISRLYRFVHERFYVTMTNYLRNHISDAFATTRQAIDASLTAYRLLQRPGLAFAWADRENHFQYIKSNLQRELSSDKPPDAKEWPHLKEVRDLIQFHDQCSQFGSHADSLTVHFQRVKTVPTENNIGQDEFHYFQIFEDDTEFIFWLIHFVVRYLYMFRLISPFFTNRLKILDPEWLTLQRRLADQLDILNAKYKPVKKLQPIETTVL